MINEGSFYSTQPNLSSLQGPISLEKNVDEVLEVEAVQHVSEINYCVWNTFELHLTAELWCLITVYKGIWMFLAGKENM